jgi:putative transcriptional regulator
MENHKGATGARFPPLAPRRPLMDAASIMGRRESVVLTGKFLIAMPGMSDPRFEKSVVYLCAHSASGAMGLIINKPAAGLEMSELMEQLSIHPVPARLLPAVHFGGPVEHSRGFVLHTTDYVRSKSTLRVNEQFAMTATLDVLEEMARGSGPGVAMMALGYAGWGAGQLEHEIAQNGWLTADASRRIVFDLPDSSKWEAALAVLGIDPLMLSPVAGRA